MYVLVSLVKAYWLVLVLSACLFAPDVMLMTTMLMMLNTKLLNL